jgi:hypothetical protein
MGLLDDAIREHLELKRRHGADPQEVARQEDEVLGAPERHEPGSEDEHAEEHLELELEEEPVVVVHEDQQELELPPVVEEPVEEPRQDVHQPTVEYSLEDKQAVEEPADELEETPEFLQETPEHDRLWFEQKPPRDFDF